MIINLKPNEKELETILNIANLIPNHTEEDEETIQFWVLFYKKDPSRAAEKISEEIGIDYQEVYNLLN